MTVIDITLLILLGGFILAGFWFGFIHMVGSLVGVVFGALISSRFYEPLAGMLHGWFGFNLNLLRIIAFILIFILITRIVGLLVAVVDKVFAVVSVIPFVKTFNRLLGTVLGLVEGTLALGLFVFFASRFPVSATSELVLRHSEVARALNVVGTVFAPLLPKALRAIQSVL